MVLGDSLIPYMKKKTLCGVFIMINQDDNIIEITRDENDTCLQGMQIWLSNFIAHDKCKLIISIVNYHSVFKTFIGDDKLISYFDSIIIVFNLNNIHYKFFNYGIGDILNIKIARKYRSTDSDLYDVLNESREVPRYKYFE